MDEKLILTLVDRFSAGNIGELELSDGSARLLLRKESSAGGTAVHSGSVTPFRTAEAPAGETAAASRPGTQPAPAGSGTAANAAVAGTEFITSPIVGTFYPSPGPDAPSFVRPGSKVKAGDTLCILEAMKMMNQLVAEFDCEITAVKAAGGDMVEYGQELFEVKRPG
ncbi:MAG: acetyl-CoA carboxylase biotin carboxyl carrier protein [Spirochaetaceae bacterium]|jgi:acetyl-CoA carboxylase biotin carboxyl carrier protein|nr:acetyl-CoA carboxylase biotin carboxyl carrier protein [Spirochaetaceae bacterium]